jgi:hypothetical protein
LSSMSFQLYPSNRAMRKDLILPDDIGSRPVT